MGFFGRVVKVWPEGRVGWAVDFARVLGGPMRGAKTHGLCTTLLMELPVNGEWGTRDILQNGLNMRAFLVDFETQRTLSSREGKCRMWDVR